MLFMFDFLVPLTPPPLSKIKSISEYPGKIFIKINTKNDVDNIMLISDIITLFSPQPLKLHGGKFPGGEFIYEVCADVSCNFRQRSF